MQTLKTSAIVVLLLTVMYGGYISLTTPPEPIPEEIVDLIQIDERFSDGDPVADTFASVQNGTQQTAGSAISALESVASSVALDSPAQSFGGSFAAPPDGSLQLQSPGVGGNAGMSPSMTLPTPAQNVSVDLGKNYPVTNSTFQLPKTQESVPFDPQAGTPFSAPANGASNTLPDAPQTELASVTLPNVGSLPSEEQETLALPPPTDNTSAPSMQLGAPSDLPTSDQPVQASLSDLPKGPSLASPSAAPAANAPDGGNIGLQNAFKTADRQYKNDQLSEALSTLSVFYNTPNITASERTELLSRLDPLARTVIYSQRHLLREPYRIGQNETLMEVAAKFSIPWQLLANINGIRDPLVVMPGTELKVVQGPFNAQVNLGRNELTVFLGEMYAGRFPIAVGSAPAPRPGSYTIQDKQSNRTFFDPSGTPVPADSPANPYGKTWLDLGSQLCIHGSHSDAKPSNSGCISLGQSNANDLYAILTLGSSVTIRR